jgi:polyisoprenoid-binding protein YceI
VKAIRTLTILLLVGAPAAAQSPAPGSIRLELTAGSKASYHVREQLARLNFPNDAVGETAAVTGSVTLRPDGSFSPDSAITVDLRTLKSDADRRDVFLRENTLHTDRFPLARFVPRRQQGLTAPLPAAGSVKFQLVGDMTMHGVTSELTWNVAATLAAGSASGRATTRFPFKTFGLTIPKVFGLISVEDDIRLQIDFKAKR